MKSKLKIRNISKVYDSKIVLNNVSFDVIEGEFLSLLGSSGCGKTTLLRIIMGIEKPNNGQIFKDDVDITSNSPSSRGMGIVFQNYALFPNMTVYGNIAYALKCRKVNKKIIKEKVENIAKIIGLEDHLNKKPSQLSGGQQQRVAIARVLVLNPDIILFDEPMAALDVDIKLSLRKELKALQKKFNMTIIYITHDQEEAFSLSDRVMVINEGEIVQLDAPKEIYKNPKNDYIKRFVVDNLDKKVNSILESTR